MLQKSSQLSGKGILLLIGLSIGWGINWPIMKTILEELPPLSFRGFCLFFAGLGILALARYSGESIKIPRSYFAKVLCICCLDILLWNILATYGLSMLPAGRAAMLGYTMPIWGIVLSAWILKENFTWRSGVGLALGIVGIFLLMSDSLAGIANAPVGAFLMIISAITGALGMIFLKKWNIPMRTMALTGWLLLLASVPLLLGAVFVDGMPSLPLSTFTVWGLVYNVLIGFMFGYWAWNKLVLILPISVSSLSSLLTPLIGVISSVVLLHEKSGVSDWVAVALILGAIWVVNSKSN
ncbi:MAG: DMT family transporter [Moraxellaceae bacterium]|nr:MAG: DMT family transporter [Moraxellaceae bacterium]